MAFVDVLQRGAVTVIDYRCTSGPGDPSFAEVHARHSLSYVRRGTFACECRGQSFELVPGSLFVGHPGDEYICSHTHHHAGDECLSFHFSPDIVDEIAPRATWQICAVPPLADLMVLGERGQAAAERRHGMQLEEAGLLLAERFATLPGGVPRRRCRPRLIDRRRVSESAAWLDAHSHEQIDLQRAAQITGLSTYHYLRVFSTILGVTPHQYLLRLRLRKSAHMLRTSDCAVTDIALDAGFNDVSNYVRTFTRAAGMSPTAFRRQVRTN